MITRSVPENSKAGASPKLGDLESRCATPGFSLSSPTQSDAYNAIQPFSPGPLQPPRRAGHADMRISQSGPAILEHDMNKANCMVTDAKDSNISWSPGGVMRTPGPLQWHLRPTQTIPAPYPTAYSSIPATSTFLFSFLSFFLPRGEFSSYYLGGAKPRFDPGIARAPERAA